MRSIRKKRPKSDSSPAPPGRVRSTFSCQFYLKKQRGDIFTPYFQRQRTRSANQKHGLPVTHACAHPRQHFATALHRAGSNKKGWTISSTLYPIHICISTFSPPPKQGPPRPIHRDSNPALGLQNSSRYSFHRRAGFGNTSCTAHQRRQAEAATHRCLRKLPALHAK